MSAPEASSQAATPSATGTATHGLRRTLRFWDVVLFLIVAIVTPRWIATAAAVGPSSIAIWAIGFVAFFIPLGHTVQDLSARHPDEGGIYVWVREAFGEFAGFMTAWLYWCSNLVYLPALLYFAAGNLLYALGPKALAYSSNAPYFISASLAGLALALLLNLRGLSVAKWLHNVGAFGMWAPVVALIVAGAIAWARFGSATSFAPAEMVPRARLEDLVFWSTIAFAFAGLECASFLGEEIVDARRTIPRALLVSGGLITAIYVLGTIAILVAVPREQVSGLQGIMQAVDIVAKRIHLEAMTRWIAIAITIGSVGSMGAWLASAARLPFVVGLDRFLPPAFARLHPKYGTPWVGLLVQGIGSALFIVLGQAGASVRGAYDAMNSMSVIVYFVPYVLMFGAAIKLARDAAGGAPRSPRTVAWSAALAIAGLLTTGASIALALMPPGDSENPALAVIKVIAGSGVLVLMGAGLYARGKSRRQAT